MITIPIDKAFMFLLVLILLTGCTNDEVIDTLESDTIENSDDSDTVASDDDSSESVCTDPLNFVFNEKEGLVLAEFEDAEFTNDWKLKTDGDTYSGDGYMVWEGNQGNQSLGNPGNGTASFKIKIETSGTYQFIWHSAVTLGDNGTEHNDT